MPQPPDGLDEVVALGRQLGVLRFDFVEFLFGEQIDGPQTLAFAPDAVEPRFDVANLRQFLVRFDFGDFSGTRRFYVQEIADLMFDVGEAAVGAVTALLGPRCFGPGFADGFECRPRRLVGCGKLRLARRQPVGGRAARSRCRLDLADQGLTLGGKFRRRGVKPAPLAPCLLVALFNRDDLRGRIVLSLIPSRALVRDRLKSAIGTLGVARDCLRFDPDLR